MKTQIYTPKVKELTEKFLEVAKLIARCYTHGQLDNLELMVLPWFEKVKWLRLSAINQIQVRRKWVDAHPEKALELDGLTAGETLEAA